MSLKKRGNWIAGAIAALLGVLCALALGVVFYGAMAYQLLDEDGKGGQAAYAGGNLTLSGVQLMSEQITESTYGGTNCTALVRVYELEGGGWAEAITARPTAYIERLAEEGYASQLITGFTLAGMDAVYALRGEERLLCARAGDTILMLRAQTDEQTLYTLGAGAVLD